MRLFLPYTVRHESVREAVASTWWRGEPFYVGGGDGSYWSLLGLLWALGDGFMLVEHDVLVQPGSLDELGSCKSDWCAFRVQYVGLTEGYAGLGCVKFSADLIARNPDAITAIATFSDPQHPAKHWCRLDAWLQGRLRERGESMCEHGPALDHIRPYDGMVLPSHGCWR